MGSWPRDADPEPGLTGDEDCPLMACGGLPAVLLGLEVRRWCWVSVWESEEDSEAWASVVCPLSLAGDSAHRLPGDFTCASGAESDLTWDPFPVRLGAPLLMLG